MMERREYYSTESPEANSEAFTTSPETTSRKKKKNKIKNNRRFSDEQISLLESIFESDTKLEPRKKLQLARELGLQPRQVAIWFQNRRARWKSKQIEQDYTTLRANFDSLASRFESLKKEKESLLLQLQELNEQMGKPEDGNNGMNDLKASYRDGSSEKENTEFEEVKPSFLEEGLNHSGFMCSQNYSSDNNMDISHLRDDQEGSNNLTNLNIGRVDGSIASHDQKWYGFDNSSTGLLDPSCSNSHWLNFWI